MAEPGYLDVLNGLPDPALVLDSRRHVVASNAAARELFGPHIEGRDIRLILRQPEILTAINTAELRGTSDRCEIVLLDRAERFLMASTSRISGDGAGFFFLLSFADVTRARLAERMRADFVANASHELRTPLSSLVGFIETLRGSAKGDPQAQDRFLGIMQEEAGRMARIIEDLLSLSRIELDRNLQPESKANIAQLVDEVITALRPTAESHGVTLEVLKTDILPTVRGDRDQIVQVLQNLINNALKYGADQSTIDVTLTPVSRIGGKTQQGVAVAIRDHGEGIDPRHIPRLTERFYRVDTARSRRLGGTGLGLAIVKHIVTRHRGELAIQSTLGSGSVFTVSFPAF